MQNPGGKWESALLQERVNFGAALARSGPKMIAVTIGVGAFYEKAAKLAAQCLLKRTGINSHILGAQHFSTSGLDHPAALKLRVFDLVDDDDVLYYDADWFCVNDWRPEEFAGNPSIVACRDFVLTTDWPLQEFGDLTLQNDGSGLKYLSGDRHSSVRRDYVTDVSEFIGLNLSPLTWINTGLFLANRAHHLRWLRAAEEIYSGKNGHHQKYFEQPAMQRAQELLAIKVKFLPRRFNVLIATEKKWSLQVLGAHIKMSKPHLFSSLQRAILRGHATPEMVEAAIWESES